MKIFYTILITLSIVLLTFFVLLEFNYISVNNLSDNNSSQTTELSETQQKQENMNNAQNTNAQNFPQEINELQAQILKQGIGEQQVNSGDEITVHYTGYLTNGTVFDSSVSRGTPFQLTIGVGQVIQGWDQGIIGMKVNEARRLLIPANLAYGNQGAGENIPPNSPLIFDVELISIDQSAEKLDDTAETSVDENLPEEETVDPEE